MAMKKLDKYIPSAGGALLGYVVGQMVARKAETHWAGMGMGAVSLFVSGQVKGAMAEALETAAWTLPNHDINYWLNEWMGEAGSHAGRASDADLKALADQLAELVATSDQAEAQPGAGDAKVQALADQLAELVAKVEAKAAALPGEPLETTDEGGRVDFGQRLYRQLDDGHDVIYLDDRRKEREFARDDNFDALAGAVAVSF